MQFLNTKKTLRLIKNCGPGWIMSKYNGSPLWVHFFLTRKCNLDCKYCYVKDNSKKELSTEEVKKVIDKLYSLGIRVIAFFGGEPTIRRDFCEILAYAHKKKIFCYFTTNGVLLNEDYIDRIAKTGVDFIELSVDSIFDFKESKKDYVHNKKVLDLLIKSKNKYGFGLKTHMVLTQKNIDTAIKTIELIKSYNIPLTIGFIGRNTYNNIPEDESLYFTTRESKNKLSDIIDKIIELKKAGAPIMDPYSYFEGMKKYINGDTKWRCCAGKYFFSVDSDGAVQLCAGLKPFPENILDIDKDYFKKNKKLIDEALKKCLSLCYSNCSFTTASLMDHPIKALLGKS